jgi:hypothetical protein
MRRCTAGVVIVDGVRSLRSGGSVPPRYELHLAGQFDESTRDAFAGLEVETRPKETIVRGQLDQAALYGVLERIRVLHLELLDVRRIRPPRQTP